MNDNEIPDTHTMAVTPTKPLNAKEARRAQAIDYLRDSYLKEGDTVYTILRAVSASGMTRWIGLVVVRDNRPLCITWNVARALDSVYDRRHEAMKTEGVGLDHGFQAVTHLARTPFNNPDALHHKWL
jgi:hypothetical protein